jgi:hypothetical protein
LTTSSFNNLDLAMTNQYSIRASRRPALFALALLIATSPSAATELPGVSPTPASLDAHLMLEALTVASGPWQPMDTGMNFDVHALTVYGGDVIAGGGFNQASGQTARFVARWDGSAWQPMGTGMNSWVRALTVHDGDLVAGGSFTSASGTSANRVARWDGSAWQPLGSGVDDPVSSVTVFDGDLIAGTYGELGGRVLRWDGSAWHAMGTGMGGENSSVRALIVHDGELFAAGSFDTAGGTPASNIARWDGSQWQPIGAGIGGDGYALIVHNGDLFAGGAFETAGETTANNIARWDGEAWHSVGTGTTGGYFDGLVFALAAFEDDLVAGGSFDTAGGVTANNIARWDGEAWQAVGEGMSGGWFDGAIFALSTFDADLIAGGDFTAAEGQTVNHVARWPGAIVSADPDGGPPAAFGLTAAYPNPFAAATTIRFMLSQPGPVRLEAHDLLGQRVAVLVASESHGSGEHEVTWQPEGLAPGVYVLRLTSGEHRQTRRVLLLR